MGCKFVNRNPEAKQAKRSFGNDELGYTDDFW